MTADGSAWYYAANAEIKDGYVQMRDYSGLRRGDQWRGQQRVFADRQIVTSSKAAIAYTAFRNGQWYWCTTAWKCDSAIPRPRASWAGGT